MFVRSRAHKHSDEHERTRTQFFFSVLKWTLFTNCSRILEQIVCICGDPQKFGQSSDLLTSVTMWTLHWTDLLKSTLHKINSEQARNCEAVHSCLGSQIRVDACAMKPVLATSYRKLQAVRLTGQHLDRTLLVAFTYFLPI